MLTLPRFQYIWAEKEYLVYYVMWQETMCAPTKLFYILTPRSAAHIVDGHCQETDALVMAAGEWTSQLHDEIFVFDSTGTALQDVAVASIAVQRATERGAGLELAFA